MYKMDKYSRKLLTNYYCANAEAHPEKYQRLKELIHLKGEIHKSIFNVEKQQIGVVFVEDDKKRKQRERELHAKAYMKAYNAKKRAEKLLNKGESGEPVKKVKKDKQIKQESQEKPIIQELKEIKEEPFIKEIPQPNRREDIDIHKLQTTLNEIQRHFAEIAEKYQSLAKSMETLKSI